MTRRSDRVWFLAHAKFGGFALAAILLTSVSGSAETTTFSCKDREGKPLMGDGPAGNACAEDICTVTNGMKKCENTPEPVPADSSRDRQAGMNHEKWLSDIAAHERYPSLDRIEAERREELQPVLDRIHDANLRLNSAVEARQGKLKDELEFYRHAPPPIELEERVKSNADEEKLAKKAIEDGDGEKKKINEKYDGYVRRFRDLEKKMQRP